MRYFIRFSYNGTPYNGWQRQPNAPSVQETLEEGLSTLLRQSIYLTGAGRTDTGVHAREMFAHFDLEEINNTEQLVFKLNAFLPPDIAVRDVFPVDSDAHARFDATSRSYEYHITRVKDPFRTHKAYQFAAPLDLNAMNAAAAILLEYTDFECFSRSRTDVKTYLCSVTEARWEVRDDLWVFHITANRFLRNMVRAIVGTLLEIGAGKQPVAWMHEVIQSKDRSRAGASAPAHGLYLTRVTYPDNLLRTT